jgi:predicted DNA-binding transcriptional regulator AlpA
MNPEVSKSEQLRILRLAAVIDITGLKRSMIYRLQSEKRFPQSVKLTVTRWAGLIAKFRRGSVTAHPHAIEERQD